MEHDAVDRLVAERAVRVRDRVCDEHVRVRLRSPARDDPLERAGMLRVLTYDEQS